MSGATKIAVQRLAHLPLGQFQIEPIRAGGVPQLAIWGQGPGSPAGVADMPALANVFLRPGTAGELRALADAIEAACPEFAGFVADVQGVPV